MSGSENKANRSTSNKIFGDHIRQFLKKMMCNKEVSRFSRAKQPQRNVQNSVLHVQICIFLLIRSIDFDAVFIARRP